MILGLTRTGVLVVRIAGATAANSSSEESQSDLATRFGLSVPILAREGQRISGSAPTRRNPLPVNDNTRFDGHNHLIIGIFDEGGKAHRKNCKQCYSTSKQRLKTVYKCEKCDVPLHVHCFKEGLILSTNSKEFWTKILSYWIDFILDLI